MENVKDIKNQWSLITKKLSRKRLSELEVSIEHYRQSLQTSKSVDSSYEALKGMFLNYFKFRLEPLQRPSYDEGRALYIKYCESCHGAKADGKGFLALNPKFPMVPAPTDLSDLAAKRPNKPSVCFFNKLRGFSNTSMTPLKDELNHHELWSLAYYVLSTSKRCVNSNKTYSNSLNIKDASFYSDRELILKGFDVDPKFRCRESSWDKLKR